MKIFFVGNYRLDNGPANVNKNIEKYLPKGSLIIKSNNFIMKILEIIWKVFISDVVIISGLSPSNNIAMNIGNILRKKTIYIMHGSIKYENDINQVENSSEENIESNILKKASLILCVSEMFMDITKKMYPEYRAKINYLNNGIDWKLTSKISENELVLKEDNIITVIGGGRIQKNNLAVCKAISELNEKYDKNYILYVIGEDGEQTEEIKKFEFVKYLGKIKHEEVINYLKKSRIYIQNSTFEPFGLAPIEALICGCDLLISKNVGVQGILSTNDDDIIQNEYDKNEIKRKIVGLEERGNNKKLLENIKKNETSCRKKAEELVDICEQVLKGKYYGEI